uniref:Uncharacterized protein n=1 Tax=Alexandrium monilatum TaxID=311494 RepID=A0A7S4Q2N4_9DINO
MAAVTPPPLDVQMHRFMAAMAASVNRIERLWEVMNLPFNEQEALQGAGGLGSAAELQTAASSNQGGAADVDATAREARDWRESGQPVPSFLFPAVGVATPEANGPQQSTAPALATASSEQVAAAANAGPVPSYIPRLAGVARRAEGYPSPTPVPAAAGWAPASAAPAASSAAAPPTSSPAAAGVPPAIPGTRLTNPVAHNRQMAALFTPPSAEQQLPGEQAVMGSVQRSQASASAAAASAAPASGAAGGGAAQAARSSSSAMVAASAACPEGGPPPPAPDMLPMPQRFRVAGGLRPMEMIMADLRACIGTISSTASSSRTGNNNRLRANPTFGSQPSRSANSASNQELLQYIDSLGQQNRRSAEVPIRNRLPQQPGRSPPTSTAEDALLWQHSSQRCRSKWQLPVFAM